MHRGGYKYHSHGSYGIIDQNSNSTELIGNFRGNPHKTISQLIYAHQRNGTDIPGISVPLLPITLKGQINSRIAHRHIPQTIIYFRCQRPTHNPKIMGFGFRLVVRTYKNPYVLGSGHCSRYRTYTEEVEINRVAVPADIKARFRQRSVPKVRTYADPEVIENIASDLNLSNMQSVMGLDRSFIEI